MFSLEPKIRIVLISKKFVRTLLDIPLFLKRRQYSFQRYNCRIVNNSNEIEAFKQKNEAITKKCRDFDYNASLAEENHGFWGKGICSCCENRVSFSYNIKTQFSSHILFTETLSCPICGSFNRIRAIYHIFKIFEKNPKNKKIYCYEQTTGFYENLKKLYSKNNEVIGSEYFGSDKTPGEYIDGIRHEDGLNLSFKDNELDYIFSNDVFEHIPDIDLALKEAKRCLKKGGKLIMRIPFELSVKKTIKRAEIKDGEIVFNTPPEYHGGFSHDDPNGCLVFYTFGCDIFDIMKKAGFKKSYGVAILDEKYANVNYDPIVVFVCEK